MISSKMRQNPQSTKYFTIPCLIGAYPWWKAVYEVTKFFKETES